MSASPAPLAAVPSEAKAQVASCAESRALSTLFLSQRSSMRRRIEDVVAQLGADALQDAELLVLHLSPADRRTGLALAQLLLGRFGGLAGVLAAAPAELRRHVTAGTVVNFKMVRAIAGRLAHGSMAARPVLGSFTAVSDFFRTQLRGLPHEEVWAAFLDKKNQLIVAERLGRGTVDHAPVYVREVIGRALECGASALVLAHNHPSGDPTPSREDIAVTKAVSDAGRALGVTVHDHLVIGAQTVASFKSLGLL